MKQNLMRLNLRIAIVVLLILVIGIGIFFSSMEPRNDRVWLDEYEKTAVADVSTSSVTIHNVRDWVYTDEILSKDWTDVSVDPRTITSAWFIVEPFGGIEGVGHTFLSFEFENGTFLSFSIQARQEMGEDYSAIKGAANSYELAYQWGTERDFIARRLLYLQHDIRVYQLEISPEDSQRLFHAVIEETNDVATTPRFYNTLTANCTNLLAKSVNKHYPDRLPYDISWNLTGYSDLYLIQQGLIKSFGSPEATRAAADLTPHRESVTDIATTPPKEFSASIRAFLTK